MIIGICSYLPNNEQVRQQRLKYHRKQLEQFLKLNCKIYIVAQNYREDEYISNPNIYYFKFNTGIKIAPARNVILNYFYNSNEDWLMLCDDDAYYYDYYDIDLFFQELNTNPDKFLQLDFIRGRFASKLPFKKVVYNEALNRENFVFKDENSIGSIALCIIKNLRKYKNTEIYFEDVNPLKGEGYEDRNFCYDLKFNNINTHILQTFIMNTYNYTDNSTLFETYEDRMKLHEMNSNNSLKKCEGTDFYKNGRMNPKYKSDLVCVKRPRKLIVPYNLIPDEVKQRKPKFEV